MERTSCQQIVKQKWPKGAIPGMPRLSRSISQGRREEKRTLVFGLGLVKINIV
jgi:hypothetical protein